jgi:hypothetical protein
MRLVLLDELAERYLAHDIVESARALAVYEKTHAALGYAVRSFDSKAKGEAVGVVLNGP